MEKKVEIMLSNHHIHLLPEHIAALFGKDHQLTPDRWLGETEFAAKETLTLAGSKGRIENIKVLGPARKYSQVELLRADIFKLGIDAPVRDSGNLADAAPITLIGSVGEVYLEHGAIIALRHIHIYRKVAEEWGIQDQQYVDVRAGGIRGVTFHNVLLRLQDIDLTVLHLDTEEGNAAGIYNKEMAEIL